MLNLIETEEKFLDPELTIEKLAVSYNIDSKTLSNLIRKKHDLNFNGYINKLRIDFFLKLIRNGEHNKLTIFAIAEKSGFKSKSTFNRVFKEYYNQTPKEYISENIKY
ncbi:helix-turn-helix domain-containing protein [Flavobacterium piscinae]|uniref:helix-turn-helix domain-containing protein n=1 Tax=Flavobacterium piscinae TaxID=2506424 RepID=UPI002AAB9C72|nr:helix-turn-helix transcriptional regulator [Flavobacterium piscinae]